MLTLDTNYLESIPIPKDAWIEEVVAGRVCFVLKVPEYCRVFWLHLWRNRLIYELADQKVYRKLNHPDLDRAVYIDAITGKLISAPLTVNSINYFATITCKSDESFDSLMGTFTKWTTLGGTLVNYNFLIIFICIISSLLLIIAIIVPNDRPYLHLI